MRERSGATLLGLILIVAMVAGMAVLIRSRQDSEREESSARVAMYSNLFTLVQAQRRFHARTGRYATSVPELAEFRLRDGVMLVGALDVGPAGWSATMRHPSVPGICTVAFGDRVRPGTTEGRPVCDP